MLEEKLLVIAGVGSGLGREVAEVAYREGARIVVTARSDTVEEIARGVDPTGARVTAQHLDVTDRDACARVLGDVAGRSGPIDALVVVAALDNVFGGIENPDWDAWHQAMEVNFFGMAYLTAGALPHLAEGASIVLVGTQTMFVPPRGVTQVVYAASKAAGIGAMRHMAVELGRRKVRINTVAPGWMWGPAVEGFVHTSSAATGTPEADILAGITRAMPLGDMPTDGDVAEVICFFASERSRAVTGQSILVNAGEYMH